MTITEDITKGRQYAGPAPLPKGAELLGVVQRGPHDVGALVRLASGAHVQMNAGIMRSLPPLPKEPVEPVQHVDLKQLARALGGILWNAVPGKERVYLERGPQSKKSVTKCWVYACSDGVLGVGVDIQRKKSLANYSDEEEFGWTNYVLDRERSVKDAVLEELKELGYKAR